MLVEKLYDTDLKYKQFKIFYDHFNKEYPTWEAEEKLAKKRDFTSKEEHESYMKKKMLAKHRTFMMKFSLLWREGSTSYRINREGMKILRGHDAWGEEQSKTDLSDALQRLFKENEKYLAIVLTRATNNILDYTERQVAFEREITLLDRQKFVLNNELVEKIHAMIFKDKYDAELLETFPEDE